MTSVDFGSLDRLCQDAVKDARLGLELRLRQELEKHGHGDVLELLVRLLVDRWLREHPAAAGRADPRESSAPVAVDSELLGRARRLASAATDGCLVDVRPNAGAAVLERTHRTTRGNEVLHDAKAVLNDLLFGESDPNLQRTHSELLTLIVPAAKAEAFSFLSAATRWSTAGTWSDPAGDANDRSAANVVIEVQYGEADDEAVGTAIIGLVQAINLLEVNEVVLYARTANLDDNTLGLG